MRFDLTSGKTKCISEDIKSNAMTVGKYSVVNPNEGNPLPDNHKLTVKVCNCRSFGCKMHVKSPILMLICFFIFCFDVLKVVFLFLFGRGICLKMSVQEDLNFGVFDTLSCEKLCFRSVGRRNF